MFLGKLFQRNTTVPSTTVNHSPGGSSPNAPSAGFRRPSPRPTPRGPDRIGIVGFQHRGFVIAKPAEPHAAWLLERSQRLHQHLGGNGTNIADGLRRAVELLSTTWDGVLRRCWLLSDGEPNIDVGSIAVVVEQARRARININTIGFGDQYDEALLRQIAGATHHGTFFPVRTLRQLTEVLVRSDNGNGRPNHRRFRRETTVLCIDLSPSMAEPMEGRRKIDVAEEAIRHLLFYKRKMFA